MRQMAMTGRKTAMRRFMRQFGRDEDGNMIVFSLFLLVMMLILGGMAVDFMRFESRRAHLQGLSDRAALAAANLKSTQDAKAVAIDYFVKAGMDQYLVGEPKVTPNGNYRSVSINAEMDLGTFFLKFVGIDRLEADARTTAIEGVGNVEVSLVVDISGSMGFATYNEDGTATGTTKIQALREAATTFVTTVLDPKYQNRISLSLVPYSQDVNIGPTLFGNFQTNHLHDFSHCLQIPDNQFNSTALDTSIVYNQGQHVQTNPEPGGAADVTEPVCPRYWYERVTYLSQNVSTLTTQISNLQPRAGTSIFLGLKWGLALLDPSVRTQVAEGLDPAFAGRPVNFGNPNDPNTTSKVLVLMTDGENQWTDLLYDEYYDAPSEYNHWDRYNFPYFQQNHMDNEISKSTYFYTRYGTPNYPGYLGGYQTNADTLTTNLCNAARTKGITVYAIAFEATPHGQTTMANCATSDAYYYDASGGELNEVFRAIAAQITDLRLTQ